LRWCHENNSVKALHIVRVVSVLDLDAVGPG